MKRTISINGPIGKFKYKNDDGKVIEVNGIQYIDVLGKLTALPSDTTELLVEVGGMGGVVEVAKQIRGALKSIQPRIAVTTKQVDDMASSTTIVFSSGSKRIVAKGINPLTGAKFQNMVHAPWTPHTEGNADQLDAEAASLRITENELADIYAEDWGVNVDLVKPLMKSEVFFDSDQALSIKFATDTYEAQNQAAYQMKTTKEKSLLDKLIAALKGEVLAAAPPAELMGKAVMVDGKAALDGVYTVVGGVVTALESVQEEAAEPAAASATGETAAYKEVLALLEKQPKQADIEAEIKKQVDAQVLAIKKSIKTDHVPVGYTPETSADDVKEWDRSFKANEHAAMKKNDPEKYQKLFYAKYKKMPNM